MNSFPHQLAERGVDSSLPLDPVQSGESGTLDGEGKVAFTAHVMSGVAQMLVTLVVEVEARRREVRGQPLNHFSGDGSGGSWRHAPYIGLFTV